MFDRPFVQATPSLMDRTLINAYATHMAASGKPATTVKLRTWQLRRASEELPPATLGTASTADLASYLAAQTWKPATLYSVRATFVDFYRWAVAAGRVHTSPADALPRIKVQHQQLPAAPSDVLDHLDADDRARLMVHLAARQGLRRCEIASIHTRDMVRDVDSWSLVVHGKGGKQRIVPLHDDIADTIRARPAGWLFPSPTGSHLTVGYVGVIISRALPDGWTAHSLRRRFATVAYHGSHDLQAVQALLRHSNLATTQVYIGRRPSSLRSALDAAA